MTVEIQNMKFKMLPTTRKNVKRMQEHFDNPSKELLQMDQFEQYRELLPFLCEPADTDASFDKIDIDELDVKQVEVVLANFLPNLMRIYGG